MLAPGRLLVRHQHAGRGAVGELAGVAGGDELVVAAHRLELGEPFHVGVGAIALVALERDGALGDLLGLLVLDLHDRGHGYDLGIEPSGLLARRRALLAHQRVLVLALAADAVALGDDVGGLDHRHVECALVLGDPLVAVELGVHVHLHEADGLEPAGHRDRHAVLRDAACSQSDRLQARGAEAVDGLAGRGHRQPGADGALAGDVAAGGALGIGRAHHHVLDIARLDAGALDGVGDDVPAHVGAMGQVEGTAYGLADRCAGG